MSGLSLRIKSQNCNLEQSKCSGKAGFDLEETALNTVSHNDFNSIYSDQN